MLSQDVVRLCQSTDTVSSILGQDDSASPGDAAKKLYGGFAKERHFAPGAHRAPATKEDLELAARCGNWGPAAAPSELFLRAYHDSLKCLEKDPLAGMVSPALMGSHGTVPLTVIAPLADVIRHCSNLIARAEKEVFFITCSWAPSAAQRLVKNALIELSRRAGERGGQRVVVKLMFDKAGPSNALDPHRVLEPEAYTAKNVQLPAPDEIPNLDFQVMGLHRLVLGTLHAKFCVIDRKIAVVMSNNMEDNDNMEMATHLEGPIVDSIYDTALITWDKHLTPPLPSRNTPASQGGLPTQTMEPTYLDRGQGRDQSQIAEAGHALSYLPEHTPEDPHYDNSLAEEINRMQAGYSTKPDETRLQAANRQLNLPVKKPIGPSGPDIVEGKEMTPYISTGTASAVPMAMVSRPAYGPMDSKNVYVPQNEAWLSLIRHAQRSIFIQTPDLNAAPLIPALVEALRRGVEVTYYVCFGYNDPGEIIPGQGGTNDQVAQNLLASLGDGDGDGARARLRIYNYVGKDQDRPIHQSFKQRSCHIKLLIADDRVGVQGSGNQDTQSWYHSQEINVMIDSEEICRKWREGIDRNQNTALFGAVSADGVWRDAEGKPAAGYMGNPGTAEGLVKGLWGMFKKMRAQAGGGK